MHADVFPMDLTGMHGGCRRRFSMGHACNMLIDTWGHKHMAMNGKHMKIAMRLGCDSVEGGMRCA